MEHFLQSVLLDLFSAIYSPEAMEFGKAKPVLFLNIAAVSSIYASRVIGGCSSNWAIVITYMKVQPLRSIRSAPRTGNGRARCVLPFSTSDGYAGMCLKAAERVKTSYCTALLAEWLKLNTDTLRYAKWKRLRWMPADFWHRRCGVLL